MKEFLKNTLVGLIPLAIILFLGTIVVGLINLLIFLFSFWALPILVIIIFVIWFANKVGKDIRRDYKKELRKKIDTRI